MVPTSKSMPEYELEVELSASQSQHRSTSLQNLSHDETLSIYTPLASLSLCSPIQYHHLKPQLASKPINTATTATATTITTTTTIQTSPLLNKLPPELRLHIYELLTPPSDQDIIARSRTLGVSSVSHAPPPLSFLLSCRQIAAEAQSFYYARAVWRLEGILNTENRWALSQVEELLSGSVVWKRLERIEVVCFWQQCWPRCWPWANKVDSGGPVWEKMRRKEEVRRRAERVGRVAEVLRSAPGLKTMVVSWKEVSGREGEVDEGWAARREVLRRLERLKGTVEFRAGELVAGEDVMGELTRYLRELNL